MFRIGLIITILISSLEIKASPLVIYGEDNRQDIYQVSQAFHKKLSQSTAGMMPIQNFTKGSKSGCYHFQGAQSLERAQNICPSEKFSSQLIGPMCSGFLVGPDTLVTAGHCYKSFSTPEEVCKKFAWVFDYGMISEKHDPTQNIPLQNIYLCKKVMFAELSQTMDFSIIKLDRVVVGREPLKFRTTGKVSELSKLVVIGHPSGLPTKISSSGRVTRNSDATKFSTNLDTFHGNSGSAVFDASTGLVEGILIQGKTDYTPKEKGNNKSCLVVNKCDELTQNCTHGVENGEIEWGEVVLRITQISTQITRAIQFQATPKSSLVKVQQ